MDFLVAHNLTMDLSFRTPKKWQGLVTAGYAPWITSDHGNRLHSMYASLHTFRTWTRKSYSPVEINQPGYCSWRSTWALTEDRCWTPLPSFPTPTKKMEMPHKNQITINSRFMEPRGWKYTAAYKRRNAVIMCLHWLPPPWVLSRTGNLHMD